MKTSTKRSPNEAQKTKKQRANRKKAPLFSVDLGMSFGMDLDFDVDDFDIIDGEAPPKPKGERQRDVRILRPRLDAGALTVKAAYENAEAFASQIDLTPGSRTFAWVSVSFIFGDIVEALITRRRVGVKRLYICSLSISQENIDSLKNVMLLMGDELERLVLVFSGYQYSHEKYNLVPYMYQELDDPQNRVQIAFGRWHCKLITLETVKGHTITVHGSANLRSSNSIEQIMVEVDDRQLHDFNANIMEDVVARFGTINAGAPYSKLKAIPEREAWEVCQSWQADQPATEAPAEAVAAPAEAAQAAATPQPSPAGSTSPIER